MGLHEMQRLFSDLTLGHVEISALEQLRSPEEARAKGYALSDHDLSLLRRIDWGAARIGLEAHRHIGHTLKRARYRRDPATGAYQGAQYPFPNPRLAHEGAMTDKDRGVSLGDLEQPVRYPPPLPAEEAPPVAVMPAPYLAYGHAYAPVPVGPPIHLRGALLRGANLSHQDFRGADLAGADLTGADLRGADLRGANLAGAVLAGAKLDGVKWK